MTTNASPVTTASTSKKPLLSLDTWAVLLAFAAALAVRLGVLKHISW